MLSVVLRVEVFRILELSARFRVLLAEWIVWFSTGPLAENVEFVMFISPFPWILFSRMKEASEMFTIEVFERELTVEEPPERLREPEFVIESAFTPP